MAQPAYFPLRAALAIVIACLLFGGVVTGQEEIRFADIPWGTSQSQTRASLEARGYSFIRYMGDGEGMLFETRMFGFDTTVFTIGATNDAAQPLVKLIVIVETGDHPVRNRRFFEAEDVYFALKETLTGRYGAPISNEDFKDPYWRGDGYETQAAENDRVDYWAFWLPDDDSAYLELNISTNVDVRVVYEGPGWSEEFERLRGKTTQDF